MSYLQKLKKSQKENLERLKKRIEDSDTKYTKDDRYWTLTRDNAGNGSALIRFLPSKEGEDVEYVKYFEHVFQVPETKRWYIEKSRTTLGEPDPVSEMNSKLWNSGDQNTAKQRKRNLRYVSNILVIKDPAHPENEGKVFLFTYVKKIYDKIKKLTHPTNDLEEVESINPFDVFTGCNFKLKTKKVAGFANYDDSEFSSQSVLCDGDEEQIERVLSSLYSLKEEVAPDKFKSYDELKKRLDHVLGNSSSFKKNKSEDNDEDLSDTSNDDSPPWENSSSNRVEDDDDDKFLERLKKEISND